MYSRVYVEITNACNMSCSFCHGTGRRKKQMSLGEFARIAGNLRGMTEYLYLHVLGEPLTHPLLPIFIEYASKCGFKVALTTNGTLLPKRGEEIILSGVYKVNISLHSFEGESEQTQKEYIEGCISFADRASKEGVLTVLRLWNIADDEIGEAAAKRNGLTLTLLRKYFGEDWTLGARGARIRDKLHIEYGERFEWPDIDGESLGDRVFCHGLGDHFAVLVDGSVVPCCLDAEGDMTLGNIFESDVRGILASERAKNIAEGFKNKRAVEELCQKCPYARRFKV